MRDQSLPEWSYSPADERVPLRATTIGSVLRTAARSAPDQIALVAGEADPERRRRWSYASLLTEAEAIAHGAQERFAPGERVALLGANEPEWVISMLGLALAGVVVVPVNPAFLPQELAQVLLPSGAVGILHSEAFRGANTVERLDALDLPAVRHRICFNALDDLARPDLVARTKLPDVAPGDLAQVQFTSGTTGFPKGACLHHAGMTNNARLMFERLGIGSRDVWVNPNPLFHLGGCGLGTLGPLQTLATHVLVPHFDAGTMLDLLESEGATVTGGVPTMMISMMEHRHFTSTDLSKLRAVSSGGSTVPAALVRRIEAGFGVRYSTMFGQTEASPGITQTHPDDGPEDKADTVGFALPHIAVKVVDPATGSVVARGVSGELAARSPMAMLGYLNRPEETASALDADGWLHTGDLGTMDDRGYCTVVGRLKEMITRGGENIYPREIEDLLFEHPAIGDVAVIGVPDEQWGELVVAVVRPVTPEPVDVEELDRWIRARLAPFKVPRQWFVADELPTSAAGKVLKHELAERWAAGDLELA